MFKILTLAVIAEALWENIKDCVQNKKIFADKFVPICFGILLCIGAKVDFFQLVQVPLYIPYLGYVFSGVLIGRGANFVHDLLKSVESLKR